MTKKANTIFTKNNPKDTKQETNAASEQLEVKEQENAEAENLSADATVSAAEVQPETNPTAENMEAAYQAQIKDLQDKYIRLMAEFDNFRKRTLKERMDQLKSAGDDILVSLLPVMDNFERGLQAMENATDVASVKQGVQLIYNKFSDFLSQRGVKSIDALRQDFDVDHHEAITKIPAPEEALKGKIVDVVQKGYILNDKVIRFAKVVIGE